MFVTTCNYSQQFMFVQEKEDTENQQPVEYAVEDKSKKTKKMDDKQEKVFNYQYTAIIGVVHVLCMYQLYSYVCNYNEFLCLIIQLQYAVLEALPKPTGTYVASDDSFTQYSLIA